MTMAAHDDRAHQTDEQVLYGIATQQAVAQRQQRISRRHGHTAQRHHTGGQQAGQKNQGQERQQHRLDGQNGSTGHQHALAALEAEIQGLKVAHHRQDGGQIHAQPGREASVGGQEVEQPAADAHGQQRP